MNILFDTNRLHISNNFALGEEKSNGSYESSREIAIMTDDSTWHHTYSKKYPSSKVWEQTEEEGSIRRGLSSLWSRLESYSCGTLRLGEHPIATFSMGVWYAYIVWIFGRLRKKKKKMAGLAEENRWGFTWPGWFGEGGVTRSAGWAWQGVGSREVASLSHNTTFG